MCLLLFLVKYWWWTVTLLWQNSEYIMRKMHLKQLIRIDVCLQQLPRGRSEMRGGCIDGRTKPNIHSELAAFPLLLSSAPAASCRCRPGSRSCSHYWSLLLYCCSFRDLCSGANESMPLCFVMVVPAYLSRQASRLLLAAASYGAVM